MKKNIKWLLLVSLSFVACNNDDDAVAETPVTAGSANFSKYVALGDSFAAGFSDGALFIKGQQNAYPNIIAGQFAQVGGGVFKSPLMSDNTGGLLFGGGLFPSDPTQFTPRLVLKGFFNPTTPNIGLVSPQGSQTTEATTVLAGPFNNLGVPGAKSFHLLAPGYGSSLGNPYFRRFASAPSTTVLADALSQNPTFFSLWIGGNDVLGYAMSGGDGSNPITPTANFDTAYNALATQLSAGGKKGVVANLPYVNNLPHFTTVPYNPLSAKALGGGNVAVGDATIGALNSQLYGPLKLALSQPTCVTADANSASRINALLNSTQMAAVVPVIKGNKLLIKDETLVNLQPQLFVIFQAPPFNMPAPQAGLFAASFGQARQASAADLILLSTQSVIGTAPTAANSGIGFAPPSPLNKFGVTFPLQDKHLLIPTELTEIQTATNAYNVTIEAAANANGLAFVDAKSIMDQLVNGGFRFGNYHMTASFLTGGAFSLDGIHPGARGYALIANKFIEAINAKYGSTLRTVDLGNYQIQYPASL